MLLSIVQNHISFAESVVFSFIPELWYVWEARSFQLFPFSLVTSLVRTSWKMAVMGNLSSLSFQIKIITAYFKKGVKPLSITWEGEEMSLLLSLKYFLLLFFLHLWGSNGHWPYIWVAILCAVSRILLFKQVFGIISWARNWTICFNTSYSLKVN